DPNDDKNVIIEIQGGAGGEEAGLWAGDLYRMLSKYAERRGFKTEPMDVGDGKYTFEIKGDGAYSVFKFEGGTHRVQRIPATESQGRIHTSTAISTSSRLRSKRTRNAAVSRTKPKADVRHAGPRRPGLGAHRHRRGRLRHARPRRAAAARTCAERRPRRADHGPRPRRRGTGDPHVPGPRALAQRRPRAGRVPPRRQGVPPHRPSRRQPCARPAPANAAA